MSVGPVQAGVLDASWTAPTTNTDGSALTDLGSYRVYYGLVTGPCPGTAPLQVASPTSSPGPNTTVSFRLTGLATGNLYYVSVSAADLSGNRERVFARGERCRPSGLSRGSNRHRQLGKRETSGALRTKRSPCRTLAVESSPGL